MGRPSKGRQVIAIERIQDKESRQVTFSKRKSGLFKKAAELSLLTGATVAVVVFSGAGKLFALGSPSVDHVLRRFAPPPGDEDDDAPALLPQVDAVAACYREAVEATARQVEETRALVASEQARLRAVGDKVLQAAGERPWWEADEEKFDEAELMEFARALQRLKDNVRRRADMLLSDPPPGEQ